MIYLASASPQRSALLAQIGVVFQVLPSDIDESVLASETALDYVQRMAWQKALSGQAERTRMGLPVAPVLGADTIVVIGSDILHKPEDKATAAALLRRLSAAEHEVHTAVCLLGQSVRRAVATTRVTFKALTDSEIDIYCASGEPLGKAGGYAIQGRAALFVVRMVGSYSGVVGLPLYECGQLLRAEGVA